MNHQTTPPMNNEILIIPDIHGRTFWKSALESGNYAKEESSSRTLIYYPVTQFVVEVK